MSLAALILVSCTTTRPIKVDNLDSDVFVVNRIVVSSTTIEPSDEELGEIFKNLPYNEIVDLVDEKTGIDLDMYLFMNNYNPEDIEYSILCDAETDEELEVLPEWEINFEPDEEDTQLCDLYFTMDPPDGYLTVKAVMHTTQTIPAQKEGKEDKIVNLESRYYKTFDNWTFKKILVDPRSSAQVKFHKNIKPTFIQNMLYSEYAKFNSTSDGYINVNIREPVEIRCNIDDPGNLLFSPAEIYNAKYEGTFQPGKQYILKYKLKRRSPDSANWIVVFSVKEVKPKLTK